MLLENEHSITCIHSIYNNEQARFFRNNGLECTVWEEKKEIAYVRPWSSSKSSKSTITIADGIWKQSLSTGMQLKKITFCHRCFLV